MNPRAKSSSTGQPSQLKLVEDKLVMWHDAAIEAHESTDYAQVALEAGKHDTQFAQKEKVPKYHVARRFAIAKRWSKH
jgi:hypothetical protein